MKELKYVVQSQIPGQLICYLRQNGGNSWVGKTIVLRLQLSEDYPTTYKDTDDQSGFLRRKAVALEISDILKI